jgi:hypothetical protein
MSFEAARWPGFRSGRERLAFSLLAVLMVLSPALAGAATLVSDKPDYAPGEIATLTGAGFEPGEWVVLQVVHADGTDNSGEDHGTWLVQADPEDGASPGGFVTTWTVCSDDCLGSTLEATAEGLTSGLTASVTFTDASQLGCNTGAGYEPNKDCPLPSDRSGDCLWGCGRINSGTGDLQCESNQYDYAPSDTVCRPSAGQCDAAEMCTGSSGDCPADMVAPASTPCTGTMNGGACDGEDHCSGTDASCVDVYKSGDVCRAAANECDVAEMCDGTQSACPADQVESASTPCTGTMNGGACDGEDHCSGTDASCVDVYKSGDVCRAAANECDVAEMCDGTQSACPADQVEPASTPCTGTSNGGVCDGVDHCSGTTASCVDVYKNGDVCRAATGQCDVEEKCDGTSGACPADEFAPSSTTCTGTSNGGPCDATDHCSGTADACLDEYEPNTTLCRADAGECDVAEYCTGSSGACPADAKAECSVVTSSALCPFDVDATACGGGDQFRLVFTPDVQSWPAYKISSSNPGQTYYNAVVNGTPGEVEDVEFDVPYPYVTVGGQALHVYDALDLGFTPGPNGACFVPGTAIQSEPVDIFIEDYAPKCVDGTCSNGLGTCAADADCVQDGSGPYGLTCGAPAGACDGADAGTPADLSTGHCTFTVGVMIPASGQAYVNLHLDYGLTGPHVDACSDGVADRYDSKAVTDGFDALENRDGSDNGTGDLIIPNCQDYVFAHDCPSATCVGSDTVSSLNDFKGIAGIIGQTMLADEGVSGLKLRLMNGSTVLATGSTDADGFYLLGYKHKGKAASFTVEIAGSNMKQDVTLKANGYAEVDWDLLTGLATVDYGSGWQPK